MGTERIDGVKINHWDMLSDDEMASIFAHTVKRRDALNWDIERIAGGLVFRGVMTAEEAYNALDSVPVSYIPEDLIEEMMGERPEL